VTRSSVAALALLLLAAPRVVAQQPDSVPGVRGLRLRPDTLRIATPLPFEGAGRLAPRRRAIAVSAAWEAALRAALAARAARRLNFLVADTTALAPAPRVEAPPPFLLEPEVQAQSPGVLGRYAEFGMQLNANLYLRFERLRNLRCTSSDAGLVGNQCRGGFSPPALEPQFDVRTRGVVGQRVHVDVDYATQREFDASNNIRVYFQGLEDEILQRVQVGNVTFVPPASRFITGGLPANNFGVAAAAQVGVMQFSGVYAQQQGNVVRTRVFTVGDRTVQPVERFLNDRDYEPLRFFFARDPRTMPGYPALDILNLNAAGLPDSTRVAQLRIYRYRQVVGRSASETNLSGIRAVALRSDSPQRVGPVVWEVLVEGRDYYVDGSGLWFALAARLDLEDYLAVSYVTATGDTVGTFPATAESGIVDTLELIAVPRAGPDVPTFFHEIRAAYRVGATDGVVKNTVQARPIVGGSERPATDAPTFMRLLGIAQSSDATSFDWYNRLFPRDLDPGGGAPLREFFVVFPHLAPFADAGALPPEYRTDSLYRTPTYLLRTQGPTPLFRIALRYDAIGGGDRGSLQIGGYQVREGSERVTADGRTLQRGVDYTVNYTIGQVTFLRPEELFERPTQVTVQFEENAAFAIAPTNIIGLTGRYDLGDHGALTAIGVWQRQRSTFTRPLLGFEPASSFVAGVVGNLRFEPLRLTRLLDALPVISAEAPSLVTLDAEIATSRPSPNQVGVAYVESFEGESGQFLSLGEGAWEYGSRPASDSGLAGSGLDPVLGFQDDDAVVLTWQNLIPASTNEPVQLLPQQIDPSIVVLGAGQQAETVLWMALHPDTVGGLVNPSTFTPRWLLPHTTGPRWRSLTLPLSSTGLDLSRSEFLEFWVLEDSRGRFEAAAPTFVFDLGTVYEDAVAFQPVAFTTSQADTLYSGRVRAGEGRLDTERDTLTATFNAQLDDTGILGDVADSILNATTATVERDMPLCRSRQGQALTVYTWGSLQAGCRRRNGVMDSEDLDNDQHLDTMIVARNEAVLRYVVRVGDARYKVRDGGTVAGVGTWRLYRVPLRADAMEIGGPDVRQIRALRMTVVVPPAAAESTLTFALARMRLVGAPWVKRSTTPIAGLSGQFGQGRGEVVASIVTTENSTDLKYEPPPGVVDQGQNVGGGLSVGATQINEKSLRVIATDLRVGERAEAFYRFPEGERNFLGYRQMRLWMRGRGAGWENGDLRAFVKVGQNQDNFYLYRALARSTSWQPEMVVDFDRWFALRALIEQRFLSGEAPSGAAQCGGDSLAYVACDGPYLVHVRDPVIAPPNLTRVQELAVGMLRDSGSAADSAELWVDDIRLTRVEDTPGWAGSVNLNVTASDIATFAAGASRRDGNFRQLGENPSYVAQSQSFVGATVRLERLGLERLGLIAPFTVRMDRASQDPALLTGTDVQSAGLTGLRTPENVSTSYSLSLRRSRRGERWWERVVVDNLALSGAWSTGSTRTELSTSTGKVANLRADYQARPRDIGFRWLPGFVRDILGGLPAGLRNGPVVQGLMGGRLRLTPARITLSSGMANTSVDRTSFRLPIEAAVDPARPVRSSTSGLRSTVGFDLQPFNTVVASLAGTWDHDLKDYGDSTTVGVVARQSRTSVLGMDVGFLRQQTLTTRLAWSLTVARWLRPRLSWTSDFRLSRDPNAGEAERADGDTAGAFRLPTTFANGATRELALPLDVPRALRGLLRDSSVLLKALDRITQLEYTARRERRSQFNRPGFDPGLGYRLGLGGMEGFLEQEGRAALSATSLAYDQVSTRITLPFSVAVTGIFGRRETGTWLLRGSAHQRQRAVEEDWPNIQGRWIWNPRGALRSVLTTVNASVAFQERTSVSQVFALAGAEGSQGLRFATLTRGVPVTLTVSWAPGVVTSASYSQERSEADRVGSRVLGERSNVAGDVRFSFKPPREFLPLPGDIRSGLRWSLSENTTCVETAGIASCIPIAVSRRTEYNLTLDTDMPPNSSAGFSAAYVRTEDRHLNRKLSQFTLTASVRIFFQAGNAQ
jgi:hypothetical protein